MLRTRLLWFTVGFTVTATAIAQFAWRDLWAERLSLSSDAKQKFDALEARVANLEPIPSQKPAQLERVDQA